MTSNNPKNPILKCVYCGVSGVKLTLEHTISKWLFREARKTATEDIVIYARKSKKKMDDQNLTTKDVCGTCNNTVLGSLDEYGRDLYRQYFSEIVQPDEKVTFKYDYNKLSR